MNERKISERKGVEQKSERTRDKERKRDDRHIKRMMKEIERAGVGETKTT